MSTLLRSKRRFTWYAWFVLSYLVLVILWGAYVRATGSGAGCGAHWPLCNGVIVQRNPEIETMVELTHRLTSAGSGLLVLLLLVWAFRLYSKRHIVRRGAVWSLVFILTEGLLGAGLVLFEWVAFNASVERAVSMALHLVNTLLLLGAVTLTAWWSGGGGALRLRRQGKVAWLVVIGLILMVILGASGAITALGDTLFPSGTLAEGISQDFLPTAHFLVRLRVYHPILAIGTGIYLVLAGRAVSAERPGRASRRALRTIVALVIIQLAAGFLNVILLVPVWMQLVHLLLADLLWIANVLMGAAALSQPVPVKQMVLAPQAGD